MSSRSDFCGMSAVSSTLVVEAETRITQDVVLPSRVTTVSGADFIAATTPATVLIPVGYRSRFGHPHTEVVARYREAGAEMLRSDRDGAIRLSVDADGRHWMRWREVARRYWHTPWIDAGPVID